MKSGTKAVVLLSGGLDSTTVLAIARSKGYDLYAMTFRYGQKHSLEVQQAQEIARAAGVVEHKIVDIDLGAFGGSALTSDIEIPKARSTEQIAHGIPITYVPARNTIFLSFALAWGEVLGCNDIFIGVNAVDYSGYPDCRPEFISAFQKMANLATRAGVQGQEQLTIHTPLAGMTKGQIIRMGTDLGVDYSLTLSCYNPDASGAACGQCDSCLLRKKGFTEAGLQDVTVYRDTNPDTK